MDNMMSTESLDPPSQPSTSSSTHFAANMTVRRRSKMACDTCHYRKIKCNVERCYPCKNCEKNSVQCTMVGPSMRPPRSISGSSSAAAAAAVAMAMATVANARLSGAAGGNGGYNFEGPLDQDGNPTIFRATSADERNRLVAGRMEDYQSMGMFSPLWARAGLSARGPDATGSRSVELPTTGSHGHRKLHAYSSPSPTIPSTSRGMFPMGASSIYSPTDPLSGHTRTQQSPPLTITTGRYVSTPTPGAHDMASDPKRLTGYDYFNLPLTQSAATTPSVTSPSFAAHTRSFAQLSLLDDSSLSASLPPTPTQSNFDKYGDGLDPTSIYKAPVPLYPTQTSQPPHRLSGQSLPVQHKQVRTASISPHPQGRDVRHQPFGLPDRRSSLPWDARISSHFGSLDNRGASKGSRQQPGASTTSASTVHGYKGRERNSLPQSLLVRSNSTPAIFGFPSTPMTSLEHQQQQQQQQQQTHLNLQSWHGLRPKVEYDTGSTSTTIVERATQDLMTATGHLRSALAQQQSSEYSMENHGQLQARGIAPFDRPFHNNAQGQVVQDIQDSTRKPMSSGLNFNSSNGVVSRQQEHQARIQRTLLQDDTHQHPSSEVWAQPELDCFEDSNMSNKDRPYFGSTTDTQVQMQAITVPRSSVSSQDISSMLSCSYSPPETQLHRPTSHPLVFDTMDHGRNDATSQQQQQQHQQQFQPGQHQLQSSQHGQNHQHPLSLKVEDLDDDAFDSSLAMVLDDHLSLMDHLNMMPDVEVYQSQISSAASMMRPTEQQHQQQQQQQQHQKITVSTSITGLHHHSQQQRFQGPMSAPVISTHHQNLFGSSELYPAPASATPANSSVRSNGYSALSESSIPSPVSPVDPTIAGEMVMIKQEFGHQPLHPLQQQQQQSMLYFDNSTLVMSEGPQSAGSNTGSNGDSTTGSSGGGRSFGYVQDTSFMHIKAEPDLDLDSQHHLQQQHIHQQQQPQPQTTSSSHYTMDRQHPFDATPVQNQHQHHQQQQQQQQHQFQHHHPQGGRFNQSTTAPTGATTATTHGIPILVAEYSHRPHQQQ
ncbi:MAG: hypothetical protein JOS17DRAFT_144347 [Linnemannia elongata]|nr:MAG: hypothetical protein JOS17DRAFT_144347 [Linnemannia elongata]